MSAILELKDVTYGYMDGPRERMILDKLSYKFESGTFYTVLGYSGSGKTTLLSLMAGMDKPKSGSILYEGNDITQIGYNQYRRNKMGVVFQQYNLLSYLTALENVWLALSETENEIPRDKRKTAVNLLDRVGIVESKAVRSVAKLSGGEQQRVAIARALAGNVELIFADEPTGNLDTDTEKEIINLFKTLTQDFGKTIIVVTHSDMVSEMSDCRLRLNKGKLISVQ